MWIADRKARECELFEMQTVTSLGLVPFLLDRGLSDGSEGHREPCLTSYTSKPSLKVRSLPTCSRRDNQITLRMPTRAQKAV